MRKTYLSVIIIIVFISFASSLIYYFLFTTRGSTFIVKSAISKYIQSNNINIKESSGNLFQGLVFYDLEVRDFKFLPSSSTVKIQKLQVHFAFFNSKGLNLEIQNGRVQLSNSALILFQGRLQNNNLDANLYFKDINIEDIAWLFSENKNFRKISGTIGNTDIYAKGPLSEPKFSGECQIDNFLRNGLSLSNCPVLFNLELKDIKKELKLYGVISTKSGILSGPKTAVINLEESRISFSGDPKKLSLDLKGTSSVEGTKINIVLKGTFDKPELKLTSVPPLSQERLLVMLITGKSWKTTELALGKGQLSVNLVKDFIDYFVLSGSGSKIAGRLGVKDISVTFEPQKKGVGVKKAVTEKIDASYAVEEFKTEEESPTTTQKVGGEYKITENITIGAEKEIKQKQQIDQAQDKQKADDKITIKFKKEF